MLPTFKEFLAEAQLTATQQFIKGLETYQTLKGEDHTRGAAIALARELSQAYGNAELTPAMQQDISDQFDAAMDDSYSGDTMTGMSKWDRQDRSRAQDDAEAAEHMNTAAEAPKRQRMGRGATMQSARFDKAKAEMDTLKDTPAPERTDRPSRGGKTQAAKAIFDEMFGENKPSVIIRRMMDEVGMSKPHATTYYYKFKKQAG